MVTVFGTCVVIKNYNHLKFFKIDLDPLSIKEKNCETHHCFEQELTHIAPRVKNENTKSHCTT